MAGEASVAITRSPASTRYRVSRPGAAADPPGRTAALPDRFPAGAGSRCALRGVEAEAPVVDVGEIVPVVRLVGGHRAILSTRRPAARPEITAPAATRSRPRPRPGRPSADRRPPSGPGQRSARGGAPVPHRGVGRGQTGVGAPGGPSSPPRPAGRLDDTTRPVSGHGRDSSTPTSTCGTPSPVEHHVAAAPLDAAARRQATPRPAAAARARGTPATSSSPAPPPSGARRRPRPSPSYPIRGTMSRAERLGGEDLLAQDVRVPAVLASSRSTCRYTQPQRQRAAPVAATTSSRPSGRRARGASRRRPPGTPPGRDSIVSASVSTNDSSGVSGMPISPRTAGDRLVEPHLLDEGRVLHQAQQRGPRRDQGAARLLLGQALQAVPQRLAVLVEECLELGLRGPWMTAGLTPGASHPRLGGSDRA
jgi:hypothetical protein